MGSMAREVSLQCLILAEKRNAWSDISLRNAIRQAQFSARDAGLCTRLTYGVLQNQMLLDWHIDRLSSRPSEQLDTGVRNAIRLGLYQLLFLDRVPPHAAVNESVTLGKKYAKNPKSASLINGVLRNFLRQQESGQCPTPEDIPIRYSHPSWFVKEFSQLLPPEELEAFLQANNSQPLIQAQTNLLKTTANALTAELTAAGVTVTPHPWMPDCLNLENTGNLEKLTAFCEGRFYVQDSAARAAVTAAAPQPGMRIMDACGAPGGKSFAAAIAMEDQGELFCCDLHPHKEKLIQEGAKRLGIQHIQTAVSDARHFFPEWENAFDLVLADVPCSGLGIIRKKPDIRYKEPKPLENLPVIQRDILLNVAKYVKLGGVLLYSTCTLLPRENDDVVSWFLKQNENFCLEPFTLPGPIGQTNGCITLWPHRHQSDGFFIAKLRRKA